MKQVFAGIDIGSTTSKCALIDENEKLLEFSIMDTLYDRNLSGENEFQLSLKKAGLSESSIARIYTTGYGRDSYQKSDKSIPEIICHGRGTVKLHPTTRTIIDIGGQDSKIIELDEYGFVSKFEMNDKCAAGTGRFFEVLSGRLLNVPLDELGPLALSATNPCMISSTCTVFAESEIVSYLSQGVKIEDVAMGILESIARRIWSMGTQTRMRMQPDIILSGGLARNQALKQAFENKFGKQMVVLENPQMPAALGAALMAKENYQ